MCCKLSYCSFTNVDLGGFNAIQALLLKTSTSLCGMSKTHSVAAVFSLTEIYSNAFNVWKENNFVYLPARPPRHFPVCLSIALIKQIFKKMWCSRHTTTKTSVMLLRMSIKYKTLNNIKTAAELNSITAAPPRSSFYLALLFTSIPAGDVSGQRLRAHVQKC